MRHARLKQCKATTLTGEQCIRPASPHSDFCWQHAADASRSKTEPAVDLAMPSAIPVEDDFGWGPTIDSYGPADGISDGQLGFVDIDIDESVSRFRLGVIVATFGIAFESDTTFLDENDNPHRLPVHLAPEFNEMIRAHARGDWGDLGDDGRHANEVALMAGGRIRSVYHSSSGEKVYVITEADQALTTIMFAEDY